MNLILFLILTYSSNLFAQNQSDTNENYYTKIDAGQLLYPENNKESCRTIFTRYPRRFYVLYLDI